MKLIPAGSFYSTCGLTVVVSAILLQGCGRQSSPQVREVDMGEKVRVGAFTYNVLESEWKNQLGDFPAVRVPEQNFLLVRVSVTNSGGKVEAIPPMVLENSHGDTYNEVQDGRGVNGWIGIFRNLNPAMTEDAWILFDVPTNSYRLKITEPDDTEGTRAAYVKIPLKL